MRRVRMRHQLPWFFSQQSWRKVWLWRWLESLGVWLLYRVPWSNPTKIFKIRLICHNNKSIKKLKELKTTVWIKDATYGMCNINDWCHGFFSGSGFSGCFRNKGPELVSVNSWTEIPVVLLVEDSNTDLSIETWMTNYWKNKLIQTLRKQLTICSSWFFRGAYHRTFLYHLATFCVFRLYRDPLRRDLSNFSLSSS